MNVEIARSGKPMPENFFDHEVIGAGFQQPGRKRMAQIMEMEVMNPCPPQSFDPSVLEQLC